MDIKVNFKEEDSLMSFTCIVDVPDAFEHLDSKEKEEHLINILFENFHQKYTITAFEEEV